MKKCSLQLVMLLLLSQALSAQVLVFPYGSSWKYLDNGTNQGTGWQSASFNDGSWKTGNGKFGYGITGASTTVSFGPDRKNKYVTTYFRKTFTVTNPETYPHFTAGLKRDDGVVVYVNGSEVFRNNMPAGTIAYNTLAAAEATDNGNTSQEFVIPSSLFISGSNTIAVEIHQYRTNSGETDMAFDLTLTAMPNLPPAVSSINRLVPLSEFTTAGTLTFRVQFSEPVNGVDVSDFSLITDGVSGMLDTGSVATAGTATYDVTVKNVTGSGTIRLDLNGSGTDITDTQGLAISSGYNSGQLYNIDQTAPVVSSINRYAPGTENTTATTLVYRIIFSEPITGLDVSDFNMVFTGSATGTLAANAVTTANNVFAAYDVSISSVSGTGTVQLNLNTTNLNIKDRAGNDLVVNLTEGPAYSVSPAPVTTFRVMSISRWLPSTESTTSSSVTYRVVFSRPVTGVDATDFLVQTISGSVRGTLASLANEPVGTTGNSAVQMVDSTTYDVSVRALSGTGTMRLELHASGTGITDRSANTLQGGYTTGETYQVDVAEQGFNQLTDLSRVPVSSHLGEKPQAKAWTYAGAWWSVLATSAGTKLFRLDGSTWTDILTLTSSTNAKADCIVAGNITHILLFRGSSSSYVVSVEYDAATNTYQLWSQRTTRATILFESGAKTATMAMDGNGRMWIASDGVGVFYVRWSDAPYNVWSAPITIGSGAIDDDICAIVALPGKIGVMWSNQNTKRFGFKTHDNGTSPTAWSADEQPAAQSALNIRFGMADDHISLCVAGDGTLYSAVKTGYDTPGYPKVALLVRRTNGVWDPLYPVTANEGTRPVVMLNEATGKVKVMYTSLEAGGDILYRESSVQNISFGSPHTLIGGNLRLIYNYSTTTHQTYANEIVILATDMSVAGAIAVVGVLAGEMPALQAVRRFSQQQNLLIMEQELISYPNPFSTTTITTFRLVQSGPYTVALFNSHGVRIGGMQRGTAKAGELQQWTFDGAALPSGTYFLTLQTAFGSQTRKLVKQ